MPAKYQARGTYMNGIGDLTVPWPTHQAYDIGFLLVETMDETPGGTWPPTGWTNISGASESGKVALFLAWKRATSSSESSVTVTDSGDHQSAVIFTVRDAKSEGTPYREVAIEAGGGNIGAGGTAAQTFGIGTCDLHDLLVMFAAHDVDTASGQFSNWINGASLGFTEQFDLSHTGNSGGGLGLAIAPQLTTSPGIAKVDLTSAGYVVLGYMSIPSASTNFLAMF